MRWLASRARPAPPFEYSSLVYASLFGIVVFGDVPDAHTLIGGAVLIAAGLMILWRERQHSRSKTPPTVGCPPE